MPTATDYTREFILRSLPPGAKRILEVGCGAGELAARLARDGFELVAIDSDAEAVAAARAAGVDARQAHWPGFSEGGFDAVLFTRSLHHVHELEQGVAAAVRCLKPGGRIIVEDFDFGFADEATLAWFAGLVRVLAAAGLPLEGSSFLSGLASGEPAALDVWRGEHDHELHPATALDAALRSAAAKVTAEHAAYFFRYVAAAGGSDKVADALRRHELELIGLGRIAPLGRRWVAEP